MKNFILFTTCVTFLSLSQLQAQELDTLTWEQLVNASDTVFLNGPDTFI